jgi:hypothetical protein
VLLSVESIEVAYSMKVGIKDQGVASLISSSPLAKAYFIKFVRRS